MASSRPRGGCKLSPFCLGGGGYGGQSGYGQGGARAFERLTLRREAKAADPTLRTEYGQADQSANWRGGAGGGSGGAPTGGSGW